MGSFELAIDNQAQISTDEGRCFIRYVLDNSDDPASTLATWSTAEDLEIFEAATQLCLSSEFQSVLAGETGPQSYGDNARLDLMYDGCVSGDMRLCDILFVNAAVGSEYLDIAQSCGGEESATLTSCSVDGEVDPNTGFADQDSAGLEAVSSDCEDGDLTACDLLFLIAPVASDHEDFGYTCGERILIGAAPDCRTSLG